jgi:hypothetical protein
MSTKTTFKRIALVTVAALGLSFVAVAPSSAAPSAIQLVASSTTGTQLTAGTYDTATAATVTLSFLNGAVAASDTASVTAYLISQPSGNTKLPVLQLVETASAIVDSVSPVETANWDPVGLENKTQVAYVTGSAASSAVSAKFRVYMDQPSKAGTYVVKLVPTNVGGGGLAADTTGVTITITVTQNPATDAVATSATSIITGSALGDTASATDVVVTATKSASTTAVRAIIKVSTKNAAGVAASESYTAVVKSGPGLLGHDTKLNAGATGTAIGRAISVPTENWVTVFSDGSSGVSTIEIQSKAGVVLATETITFFGDATVATSTVAKAVIGLTATSAIVVSLKDAAGTAITSAQTFYVTSSATSVIAGAYSTTGSLSYSADDGGYLISLTGLTAGTANITVGTKSSASATTGVDAAAVAIRVGGGATKLDDVTVAFDKASYLPGELAVITVTPVDSAGLILAPDTYTVFATGGIVAPVALGSSSATITGTDAHNGGVAGKGTSSGVATYKVYMPAYAGTFVFKYTTGTMATSA